VSAASGPPVLAEEERGLERGDREAGPGRLASRLTRRSGAAPGWALAGAAAVAVFLALALAGEVLGGEPTGPPSSSYATNGRGLAAWAELLNRAGYSVSPLRTPLARARLDPADTVVVLDPEALLPEEGAELLRFVRGGGRLVIGGSEAQSSIPALIPHPPPWSSSGSVRQLARAGGGTTVAGVSEVTSAGEGEWTASVGYRAPLRGTSTGSVLLERDVGRGRVELLADASPLQNRLLASADNAQLAINLAGGQARPVVFVESVHGFGDSRGFAALPGRWQLALALLALAGLLWVIARGRRLGPAEREGSTTPPPRAAYVDAMGLLLRRSGKPQELSAELRRLRDRG
jgi:Domain of unknown function (DUF4350)